MAKHSHVNVIIPTRNRSDTLRHALRTVTQQDYDQLTIFVSDNASDDETRVVVEAVNDPRVRYLNTGRRMSMSRNWEFALGHVDNGLVLVVGDDDALLPNAIVDIVRILNETGCDGMAWREPRYYWPNCGGGAPGNTLRMSLRTGWRRVDTRTALERVMSGTEEDYRVLPGLYWGALDNEALRRARGKDGQFFHSLNPDLYSAFAASMTMERYVWSERPYRINGMSKHSTGVSFAAVDRRVDSPREQFLNEGNLPFHDRFVLAPSPPVYIAEAYEQVRDHVPGAAEAHQPLDTTNVLEQMMRTAARDRDTVYPLVVEAVREIARRDGGKLDVESVIARHSHHAFESREPTFGVNIARRSLKLDCNDFAVKNVYDAAMLCHTIMRLFEADYLTPRGIARRAWSAVRDRLAARLSNG